MRLICIKEHFPVNYAYWNMHCLPTALKLKRGKSLLVQFVNKSLQLICNKSAIGKIHWQRIIISFHRLLYYHPRRRASNFASPFFITYKNLSLNFSRC